MIQTSRLSMSPITESDWELFRELLTSPSVIALCFDAPEEDDIRRQFESRLPEWTPESEAWLCLVLREKASGKSIGVTGFFMDKGIAEVGYLLLPDFHGKQYGTESLKALLKWAESEHQLTQFRAIVSEGNVASERVLEKNGFELKETVPDAYEIGGKMYADRIFTLSL
ncbi:acetyltransferase [Vibrio nigripulchritudo ATCC 27043]|uniref:GNAT family N-acetyltransferase n=1 Tax=Vibrio nigripulchritudo TaxID=28173 RepID=UPI00021C14ED|nr:GNAT family N-acetyltransferase [Vibrio nigripulchritudo]EGU57556.1 acetyltransferase [Vibrio nigripulchritudo ATCC 27043]